MLEATFDKPWGFIRQSALERSRKGWRTASQLGVERLSTCYEITFNKIPLAQDHRAPPARHAGPADLGSLDGTTQ